MSNPPRARTDVDVFAEYQERLDVLERILIGLSSAVASSNGVNVYQFHWPSPGSPSLGVSDADPAKATSSLFGWIAAATTAGPSDATIDLLVNGVVVGTLTILAGNQIGFVGVDADLVYGTHLVQAQVTADGGCVGLVANALAVL